jgi:hypothetical protein
MGKGAVIYDVNKESEWRPVPPDSCKSRIDKKYDAGGRGAACWIVSLLAYALSELHRPQEGKDRIV